MNHKGTENGDNLTITCEIIGIFSEGKINVCSCQTVKEDLISDCIISIMVSTRVHFSQRDVLS